MAETREALWRIGLSSISAATAEMATFPIDIVKTRLQLNVERRRLRPSAAGVAVFLVASEIWGNGGFLGFYSGFSPAILRHIFYTPIRIVGYEHLRNFAGAGDSIVGKAISGGISGVFAQVISGIETTVILMKVGGIRQVIIPLSQGYKNTSQELIPPNDSEDSRGNDDEEDVEDVIAEDELMNKILEVKGRIDSEATTD